MKEAPATQQVHCNSCARETRHGVVTTRVHGGSETVDPDHEISWRNTYTLLECLGCDGVCLRQVFWFSEDPREEEVTFYPPQVSRRAPVWIHDLEFRFQILLAEIYAALHADSRSLAIMGARTIIDVFMQKNVGDIGGFDQKLDALVKAGYLSSRNREVLAAALEAGHAAAHRGHRPSVDDCNHVMDIVENVLQSEILPHSAQALQRSTPSRQRRAREVSPAEPDGGSGDA